MENWNEILTYIKETVKTETMHLEAIHVDDIASEIAENLLKQRKDLTIELINNEINHVLQNSNRNIGVHFSFSDDAFASNEDIQRDNLIEHLQEQTDFDQRLVVCLAIDDFSVDDTIITLRDEFPNEFQQAYGKYTDHTIRDKIRERKRLILRMIGDSITRPSRMERKKKNQQLFFERLQEEHIFDQALVKNKEQGKSTDQTIQILRKDFPYEFKKRYGEYTNFTIRDKINHRNTEIISKINGEIYGY